MSDAEQHHLDELHEQVAYLESALAAISRGGVDAVVVGEQDDAKLYTLTSADRPYRVIVENMGEGAITVSEGGVILYANPRIAELLGVEREAMVGRDVISYVAAEQQPALAGLLSDTGAETRRAELTLTRVDATTMSFQVAVSDLDLEGVTVRCLVLTDLAMQKRYEQQLADAATVTERQRMAREVNDTIVQGLVTAEMALDLADLARAREAIVSTSAHAREWIGELADGRMEPGSAVRSEPARTKPVNP